MGIRDCETEAAAGAALAQKPFTLTIGQREYLMRPTDGEWIAEDLDSDPAYVSASPKFSALDDLCAYVERYGSPGSAFFAHQPSRTISAVIDFHQPDGDPGRCKHHGSWRADFSSDFAAWHGINGLSLTQDDFVRFLEDHAENISEPDGATIMELAVRFDAIQKVDFTSVTNLSTGDRQIKYESETDGKGAVKAPKFMMLSIPVYLGQENSPIKVLLRYRIHDGALKFQIDIHRLQETLDLAFETCIDQVRDLLPDNPLFRGQL